MDKFTDLKQGTEKLFAEQSIEEHTFFTALKENRLSANQVKEASLQIYHVVEFFPRFIAAVLTNIPDYKMRMPLVENLYEEHGNMNEKLVHSVTYKEFLTGLGITEIEIQSSKPSFPVIAYNRSISDLCLHYNYLEGLAALGVIEEIVARVSPIVGRYASTQYGSNNESLVHFTDHETLDVTHANEIYEVIATQYEGDNKAVVDRGLNLGLYYHRKLYTDILEVVQKS
jgi:pyrroloquinoline-quinone synthase